MAELYPRSVKNTAAVSASVTVPPIAFSTKFTIANANTAIIKPIIAYKIVF